MNHDEWTGAVRRGAGDDRRPDDSERPPPPVAEPGLDQLGRHAPEAERWLAVL